MSHSQTTTIATPTMPTGIRLRYDVRPADRIAVRRIVESTNFFASDEGDVAVELVDERLVKGESCGYFFAFADIEPSSETQQPDNAGSETVAYVCYGPIPCTVGSFDLYWIAVDQSAQRRGLGRVLLNEAERLIRKEDGRHVYIETANRRLYAPTQNFYESCGYECVSVLADFYGIGDDKVTFRKVL